MLPGKGERQVRFSFVNPNPNPSLIKMISPKILLMRNIKVDKSISQIIYTNALTETCFPFSLVLIDCFFNSLVNWYILCV